MGLGLGLGFGFGRVALRLGEHLGCGGLRLLRRLEQLELLAWSGSG